MTFFFDKNKFFNAEKNEVPETRVKMFFDIITSKIFMNKKNIPVGATTANFFFKCAFLNFFLLFFSRLYSWSSLSYAEKRSKFPQSY